MLSRFDFIYIRDTLFVFLVMERGWFFKHLKLDYSFSDKVKAFIFVTLKKVFFTIVFSHYTHV